MKISALIKINWDLVDGWITEMRKRCAKAQGSESPTRPVIPSKSIPAAQEQTEQAMAILKQDPPMPDWIWKFLTEERLQNHSGPTLTHQLRGKFKNLEKALNADPNKRFDILSTHHLPVIDHVIDQHAQRILGIVREQLGFDLTQKDLNEIILAYIWLYEEYPEGVKPTPDEIKGSFEIEENMNKEGRYVTLNQENLINGFVCMRLPACSDPPKDTLRLCATDYSPILKVLHKDIYVLAETGRTFTSEWLYKLKK